MNVRGRRKRTKGYRGLPENLRPPKPSDYRYSFDSKDRTTVNLRLGTEIVLPPVSRREGSTPDKRPPPTSRSETPARTSTPPSPTRNPFYRTGPVYTVDRKLELVVVGPEHTERPSPSDRTFFPDNREGVSRTNPGDSSLPLHPTEYRPSTPNLGLDLTDLHRRPRGRPRTPRTGVQVSYPRRRNPDGNV